MALDYRVRPWPTLRNAVDHGLSLHRQHTYYGTGEADVTEALAAIRRLGRASRLAISGHAWVAHCLAQAAVAHPEVLTFRHGKTLVTFQDADVCTTIARRLPDHTPIAGAYTLRAAQTKSLAELNRELRAATRTPLAVDTAGKMRQRLARMPWLVRRAESWRTRRNPHRLREIFGTIGLTTVRTDDFRNPFFILPPNFYTLTVAVGSVAERFVLDAEGRPRPRKIMFLAAGIDHLVADGLPMARFARTFVGFLEGGLGLDDTLLAELKAQSDKDGRS